MHEAITEFPICLQALVALTLSNICIYSIVENSNKDRITEEENAEV